MANTTDYLKKQYAAQQQAALAELKSAYDTNISKLDEEAAAIPQQYETARNEMAAQNAIARKNFNEQAAATGLNTGTSGQAELARSSVYQRNLAGANVAEQNAQQALDRDRLSLQAQYENAIAATKAENDAALNNALYQEMLRRQSYGSGKKAPVVDYTYKDKIWNTPSAKELYNPNATYSEVVRSIRAAQQSGQTDFADRLAEAYFNSRPEWQKKMLEEGLAEPVI
jgi:hypothetical protein